MNWKLGFVAIGITCKQLFPYNYSELGSRLVAVEGNDFFTLQRDPQRNYGVEATVDWQADENWQIGGIFSWNEGNFENDEGEFVPLGRFDIQPLKLTAYVEHQTTPGWRNRLQALYVRDRAFDEDIDPVAIEGYFLLDYIITSIQVGQGQLQIGIENLLDNQYRPVYFQALLRPIDFFW